MVNFVLYVFYHNFFKKLFQTQAQYCGSQKAKQEHGEPEAIKKFREAAEKRPKHTGSCHDF